MIIFIEDIYRVIGDESIREFKSRGDHDVVTSDGVPAYGQRLVRKDGSFLYAKSRWQDDLLRPLAGLIIGVSSECFWLTEVSLWWRRYPHGKCFGHLSLRGNNIYRASRPPRKVSLAPVVPQRAPDE